MPSDSNGVYSLPTGYLATTGETIQASQHNPPLEDIAAAITARLMRSGAAPMTGPLRVPDGTVDAPTLAFASDPSAGFYLSDGKIIPTKPLVTGVRYVGELIIHSSFLGPPPGCVWPYGQTLSRTTYAALWAVAQAEIAQGSLFYNNGNGTTTFGIADLRGRVVAGRDNMGGTPAFRLSSTYFGANGSAPGAVGGVESKTLAAANLPPHTHSGGTGGMNRNNPHTHGGVATRSNITSGGFAAGGPDYIGNLTGTTGATDIDHEHTFTTDGGSGLTSTPLATVQPTIIVDFVLYTGA